MINAGEELLDSLFNVDSSVKCAYIVCGSKRIVLREDFEDDEWESFIEYFDFEYDRNDDWYKIHGYVWFEDGSWLERNALNPSWIHHRCPNIPEECKEGLK